MKSRIKHDFDYYYNGNEDGADYSNAEYNPRLKAMLLQVVDNQINDETPIETKRTVKRLIALGYTELQAKEKIAAIVLTTIYDVQSTGKPFDEAKYIKALSDLK